MTEAMLGMLGKGGFAPGPPFMAAGSQAGSQAGGGRGGGNAPLLPRARRAAGGVHAAAELRHLSALREAMAGAGSGRLPLHLLLSDRDFDENDYEALLALDDNVESRKGWSCAERPVCWRRPSMLAKLTPCIADIRCCGCRLLLVQLVYSEHVLPVIMLQGSTQRFRFSLRPLEQCFPSVSIHNCVADLSMVSGVTHCWTTAPPCHRRHVMGHMVQSCAYACARRGQGTKRLGEAGVIRRL